MELTWTEGTVCGRAALSMGRDVKPVDETPDPRRATAVFYDYFRDSLINFIMDFVSA